jgi:Concanavalin A-like lectin/glucanases superfamily/Secretion system C-terminal sorting domain
MKKIHPFIHFGEKSALLNLKDRFINSSKKFAVVLITVLSIQSASGQTGRALDFDGVNDYVTLPNLLPNGSYTKEAWINIRAIGAFTNNIASGISSAFWVPGGNLSAGNNFANFAVQDPTPLVTGTWYHVAVTYNSATNAMILYKNAVQVDAQTALAYGPETECYLGTYNNGGGPGGFLFNGQMDEVRIWNTVRTQAQIAASMSCELTGDEPGLIAYYNFNQGTAGANNAGINTLTDVSDHCTTSNGVLSGFALNGATSNWVAPGGTVAGTCANNFPNIAVTGNSVCITIGDPSPSTADFTDFNGTLSRTFTIQNTGNTTLNITSVTITGVNQSEFSVTSAPSATVAAAGSTTFTVTFAPATNGAKSAIVNVNNDDGDEGVYSFNIAAAFFTLPVNMTSFTVKKDGTHSQLTWVTASESDNIGFDVQRSLDGRTWNNIAFVPGAGTTSTERTYAYTDLTPAKGTNYYRINQRDFNNHGTYSEVRAVTFANLATLVYPVPTNDKIVIELIDSRLIGTHAVISDLQGKIIRQVTLTKMQQEISLAALPAGTYLLKTDDGVTHKLIKQ